LIRCVGDPVFCAPNIGTGGHLGPQHSPLFVGSGSNHPAMPSFRGPDELFGATDPERLEGRRRLLDNLQSSKSGNEESQVLREWQELHRRAFELAGGPEARQVFELHREPEPVRERYGRHPLGQNLLLARRLVEAGVGFVTVNGWTGPAPEGAGGGTRPVSSSWDMHGGHMGMGNAFGTGSYGMGWCLPRLDEALAALLTDLRERGLDLDQAVLFVIDGGSGLRKAIRESCGTAAIVQRCQVHKRRNVLEHLPEGIRPRVGRVLSEAYGLADAALAKRRLLQLAAGLDQTHPGAAASLREGLDETLTLQRLGVDGALYRTLRSTNAIENLNGLVGHFVRHVRRWRNGLMLVRWIAAGLRESARSFRRLRGHRDLAALIRALDRQTMDTRKEVA
jgi:hypothetical protein